MRFDSTESLKEEGFEGFRRIGDLMENCDEIPNKRGVYLVLYMGNFPPGFLEKGSGGHFKGKDPNVTVDVLNDRWVYGTIVIYIGKTDGRLCKRISDYMEFGKGNEKGHHGGRYIWQISNCEDLALCWKSCDDRPESSRQIECDLLLKFKTIYDELPFANLKGCRSRGGLANDGSA